MKTFKVEIWGKIGKVGNFKSGGNENEILHFGTFSVRDEAFQKIFLEKIFFEKIFWREKSSPDFEKSSKM